MKIDLFNLGLKTGKFIGSPRANVPASMALLTHYDDNDNLSSEDYLELQEQNRSFTSDDASRVEDMRRLQRYQELAPRLRDVEYLAANLRKTYYALENVAAD